MTNSNFVFFVGRVVADATLEQKGDLFISKFCVVVNRDVHKENGEKISAPNFINLTIFDKFAQKTSPNLLKGKQVCVSGHLKENKWTDEKGNHSKLVVVVDKLEFLGRKNELAPVQSDQKSSASVQTETGAEETVSFENDNQHQLTDDEYNEFF